MSKKQNLITKLKNISKESINSEGKFYTKLLVFFENSIKKIDEFIHFIFNMKNEKYKIDDIVNEAKAPIIFGHWVVIITFGLGGGWMMFAPLDSASIAEGTITVSSKVKNIQHLEGGIIEKIFVKEGDHVKENDPIIRLTESHTKYSHANYENQLFTYQATEDRIIAERDNLEEIKFSEILLKNQHIPEIVRIMDTQKRLFETRRESMINSLQISEHKIMTGEQEVLSLTSLLVSAKKQLSITREQGKSIEELHNKRILKRNSYLDFQKSLASAAGAVADLEAKISGAQQRINSNKVEILNSKTARINEIIVTLRETQLQLVNIRENLKSQEDKLNRVLVVAPQDGIIKHLSFNTVGGVVRSGETIVEIIPLADRLIVEAKVKISDIDRIIVGQKAKIRVFAYKSRIVPFLKGKVVYISPDSFDDQRTRMPYYLAKIEIDTKQYTENTRLKDLILYPGMRADVLIITGSRTFFAYLIGPFIDTITKSFTER